MARKITVEEIKERLKLVHGDTVTLDESTYSGTKVKARFIDCEYGEFYATLGNVLWNHRRHPEHGKLVTAAKLSIPVHEIKKRVKEIYNGVVEIDEKTYVNMSTKCRFIDSQYGEFYSLPSRVLGRHQRHPRKKIDYLITKNTILSDEIDKRVRKISDGVLSIKIETYKNTTTACIFIDRDFGEFEALPERILAGEKKHPQRTQEKIKKLYTTDISAVKEKLLEMYDDEITIDESTYTRMGKLAKFIDKQHGEWWSAPNAVINCKKVNRLRGAEKHKETCIARYGVDSYSKTEEYKNKVIDTCMERYGVSSPSQSTTIGLKMARSSNKAVRLKHWKTGEEVVCIASYEKKTVEYFNTNNIDYKWQPKTFDVIVDGKARTYRPDCYLPEQDKWIEIKGYFRGYAKEKWDYFHQNIHTNSELWNKAKLEELGIL